MVCCRILGYAILLPNTTTAVISSLSLHDALPILPDRSLRTRAVRSSTGPRPPIPGPPRATVPFRLRKPFADGPRSEEHTSELQSRENLVCRLLLEKKKKKMVRSIKNRYAT